ncbi:MAG: FecR domain-containing protein, partial [Chloroflexi bacterium]|nr:FecR domain-containing protein [Chloroflexota bacterium]
MFSRAFWLSLLSIILLLATGLYSLPKLRPGSLAPAPQPFAVWEDAPPDARHADEVRRGPCEPGRQVAAEEEVTTAEDGWASLCLPDASRVYLGGATALRLGWQPNGAGALQPRVTLALGKVWIDLRSGSLSVTTDIGTASVSGSLMSVSYIAATKKMLVTCAEGHCRLRGTAAEVALIGLQQSALVGPSSPNPARPIEAEEILDWFAHVPGLGSPESEAAPTETPLAASTASPEESPTAAETSSLTPAPSETLAPTPMPTATFAATETAPPRPASIATATFAAIPTHTLVPTLVPTQTKAPPTSTPAASATLPPGPTSITAASVTPTRIAPTATGFVATPTATLTLAPTATWTPSPITPSTPTATPIVVTGRYGAGPIPGPSPTWSVHDFPAPLPASGPTKLGFHVTLNGGGVLDYVAAVHPPVIKGVDDVGFLKDVKAISPGTITVGRFVVPQPNIGEGDPAQRAIEFVNEQLPRYQQHAAYVDYWEGWNEVTYPNYEWYAIFEATRACEMQKYGFRAAIGAFSAGTPEPWQFMAFLPAIEAGIRCGAILTTHEYAAPTMYLWWAQGLPESYGHPPVPAYPDRGPLAGRYRFLYRDILIPRGLDIPLVISEAGIDGGAGAGQRPGYGGQGWLGFREYWSNELGIADPVEF